MGFQTFFFSDPFASYYYFHERMNYGAADRHYYYLRTSETRPQTAARTACRLSLHRPLYVTLLTL